MSDEREARLDLAGPGMMLLSAAIFGYIGFGMGLAHTNPSGQLVPFYALLDWTCKVSAVVFFLAALITMARPVVGNLVYSVGGLAGAVSFLAVAAMDMADKQHAGAIPLFLLVVFAAWNGYGSWSGLKAVLAIRARQSPTEPGFGPPPE